MQDYSLTHQARAPEVGPGHGVDPISDTSKE